MKRHINVVFRLKLSSDQLNHPETIESPVMPAITSDLNIPLSKYKWNQIDELQLSDGEKVHST